ALKALLNVLENSFDLVFLIDKNNSISYSFFRGNLGEDTGEISKIVLECIKSANKSSVFNTERLKLNLIKTAISETPFICTGLLIPGLKQNSLLWNSFYTKENPVYSSIAEDITGYSSDEISSLPGRAFSLIEEGEAEKIKSRITGFIVSPLQNKLELTYRIRTKSGKIIWVREMVLAERGNKGEIIKYDCSLSDFTQLLDEKTVINNELQNLKNLNQAKDQFISVLSHDLKSPYTSILGFSEILLNETSLSQEERNEYLSYINSSSQNQLKLIDNLLEWSRLITGRKRIEKNKINLKSIINNVVSNNTRSIHQKNIEIKLSGDNYLYVDADERLLYSVLNIFISNAVKYSYPDKLIEIHINKFKDNQVEVIIKDEGTGMNENIKGKLLKIESIISLPGTSGEKGTGISLLLANEIIKIHKGEMWFYSEEGRGSEFHFTIPAASNVILLIDKDESEKSKIGNMLRITFPEFTPVAELNFYSALKVVRTKNPAVIIMEHKLPLMDGLEFIKILRSKEKYTEIPVIIYGSELTEKNREKYSAAGVTDILSKPVDLKILKEKLEKHLK
ncbi:MAG: response regulator, partial [Ignavibacteriales bacterium]